MTAREQSKDGRFIESMYGTMDLARTYSSKSMQWRLFLTPWKTGSRVDEARDKISPRTHSQ